MEGLFLVLAIAGAVASAAPGEPVAHAGEVPALAKLLERTGWTPTPELTGNIKIGDVFATTPQGEQWQAEGCLSATPRVAPYTEVEVSSQLQLGVSVRAGIARVGGEATLTKVMRFGAPEHHSLPGLGLQLTPACRDPLLALADRGADLRDWYIVKEVMVAEISEQTCGEVDAEGRFLAFSGEADLQQSCAQASQGKVAVAWRTVRLPDLDPALARPGTAPLAQGPAGAPAAVPAAEVMAPAPPEPGLSDNELVAMARLAEMSAPPVGSRAPSSPSADPLVAALMQGASELPSAVDAAPPPATPAVAASPPADLGGLRTDGFYACLVPILGTALLTQPVGLLVSAEGRGAVIFALTGRGLERNYWASRASLDRSRSAPQAVAIEHGAAFIFDGLDVVVRQTFADSAIFDVWWKGVNRVNGIGASKLECDFLSER
jgi:hypothetical protein